MTSVFQVSVLLLIMHFVITNNIVKVAVNPQANSRVDVQTSLTMLWGNSDVNFFNNKYQIMGLFTYRQWQLANGHAKITAVIVKHPINLHGSLLTLQSTRFTHERTTSNIHKIFHSPIWFFNYEIILRTFNCTIVNQIKSSKKLVVKLKIRNKQLLQMKTIFKLFFSRVPLFSRGNKWATVSPPRWVF